MTDYRGTPASSQIIWLEGRVRELEAEVERLTEERVEYRKNTCRTTNAVLDLYRADIQRLEDENERMVRE